MLKSSKDIRQMLLISCIATFLEWFDFSIFAFAARRITEGIVTDTTNNIKWLAFSCSYVARPIGSLIFGYIGDTRGRQVSIFYSLLLMGISTFSLSFLPTYDQIGIQSIIMLYLIRFMQGIFLAGEHHSATIFLLDKYKGAERNKLASFVNIFNGLGLIAGSAISYILEMPGMPFDAWRTVLKIGLLTSLFAFYVRHICQQNIVFKEYSSIKKPSFIRHIREGLFGNIWEVLGIFSISAVVAAYFYGCNIWWRDYVAQNNVINSQIAQIMGTIGIVVVAIMASITGQLADKIKNKYNSSNITVFGIILSLFCIPVIFKLNITNCWLAPILYGLPYGILSPLATLYCYDLIKDPRTKATKIGFFWQTSSAIFGGFVPFILNNIHRYGGIDTVIIAMMAIMVVFCIVIDLSFNKIKINQI